MTIPSQSWTPWESPPISSLDTPRETLMLGIPSFFDDFFFWYNRVSVGVFYCPGSSMPHRLFSSCGKLGLLSSCGGWLLMVVPSRCRAGALGRGLSRCGSRLESTGSQLAAHTLSCSAARGIFPDQGSNPCLLPQQVNCLSLSHQGSPVTSFWL